jgi:hypothetical protein
MPAIEVNFGSYQCVYCLREKTAHLIDWDNRDTVDSLTESMHYFAKLQHSRNYAKLEWLGVVRASRGIVCNMIGITANIVTPLTTVVTESYKYYVLYNRRYLLYGDRRFERASSIRGNWQTVHKKVIDAAALENFVGPLRDHVCIVIVMQDKTVWYINPSLMKKFCFEYETEDIPFGEVEPEGHIPINREPMISRNDPFIPIPNANTKSSI